MILRSYPAGNDNAGDNRNKSNIRDPALLLESHNIRKHSREERRGGADGLVKRHGEVPERDVPANDRQAEDETEGRYLEELDA